MENKVPRTANAALRKAFARRRHPHTPLDAFHFAPKARNDTTCTVARTCTLSLRPIAASEHACSIFYSPVYSPCRPEMWDGPCVGDSGAQLVLKGTLGP